MLEQVAVVQYTEEWKTDFETIKNHLLNNLNNINIEHIGSTSVDGLMARPIIDIAIIIENYTLFNELISKLESLGYIYKDNHGIQDGAVFHYNHKDLPRHKVYVFPEFSAELQKHIAFRNYLRKNSDAKNEYQKAKKVAAEYYPNSIDEYNALKSGCIEKLYKECGLTPSNTRERKDLTSEEKNISFEEYQTINGTYDQQMAAIQTVITICTAISTAVLVAMCSNDVVLKAFSEGVNEKIPIIPVIVILIIAIICTICCLISITAQINSCKELRNELHKIEIQLKLYEMHKDNKLKKSFIATIICFVCTALAFIVLLVTYIIKLY